VPSGSIIGECVDHLPQISWQTGPGSYTVIIMHRIAQRFDFEGPVSSAYQLTENQAVTAILYAGDTELDRVVFDTVCTGEPVPTTAPASGDTTAPPATTMETLPFTGVETWLVWVALCVLALGGVLLISVRRGEGNA